MKNKASNGLIFNKEFDEKEFLRKTLLSFAKDSTAPEDIIESDFDDVRTDTFQALAIGTNVDLNYSVSVGYVRQVEKEKYNERTNKFETHYEKVTDWHPLSDSFSLQCNGYAENSVNPRNELTPYIAKAYNTTKSENKRRTSDSDAESEQSVSVKDNALESAKDYAKQTAVRACQKNLPGDTFKDFRYNGSIEVTSGAKLAIPVYSVDYKYDDKTYTAYSFASGEYGRWGKAPERKDKAKKDVSKKPSVLSMFSEAIKSSSKDDGETSGELIKMTSIATFLTTFLTGLAIMLPMILGKTAGIVLFVLASISIALQTTVLPQIIETRFSSLLKRKEATLRAQFEKHGLPPFTDEELNIIREDINKGKNNNSKTNSMALIICSFLYIVAAIMSESIILGLIVGLVIIAVKVFLRFKSKKN